jgi:S-adenosylmethionine-dependent methyltransferase
VTRARVRYVETARPREFVAPLRQRLVSRLLAEVVSTISVSGQAPAVLDCGGGSGSSAVPLAQSGARVTVVDVSADALATLRRRAVEAGVDDLVFPMQGDVEALGEVVPGESFDLVLAHGVLEAIDRPDIALAGIAKAVRPAGRVSILVSNPVASVLSRALAGDVSAALFELRAMHDTPGRLLDVVTVRAICDRIGLVVEQVHGVGVFSELAPGAELDARPNAVDALAELEELASIQSPYREIASRIHLLARRRPG